MACRDYEYEYDRWLERGERRLREMVAMLRELCERAGRARIDFPDEVATGLDGLADRVRGALSKETFDGVARMLCAMCRTAEAAALPLEGEVAVWWARHKALDDHAAELDAGLAPTPTFADFWHEHAARRQIEAEFPGVAYRDAIRTFESFGFRLVREGKHVKMANEVTSFLIQRADPINSFAMASLIRIAGLTDAAFRERLEEIQRSK